jgi:hypothetical protein
MFQVTQIVLVRFLLEHGLRFRDLAFCGHDFKLMKTATSVQSSVQYAPVPIYPEGLAFVLPFLEGHGPGAFACDQDSDLAPAVCIRDLNRTAAVTGRSGGLPQWVSHHAAVTAQ